MPPNRTKLLTGCDNRLSATSPLKKPLSLGAKDSLKVMITAKEGDKAKRPHQAFLILKETESGLEVPFPMELKDNGRGVVDVVRPLNMILISNRNGP